MAMLNVDAKAHQLVDNITTAILVFDSDLCLTYMNTAGENLLFMSARKLTGLKAAAVLPQSPHFIETLQRSRNTKQPFTERGVELKLPGARSITVDCMVTPLLEKEQCLEVIVEMVGTNLLARVMREENLSVIHDSARQSLRGMAHEIKNPLGGLRGAAQLLERELNGSELTEYTQIIISEADRLRKLIDRMLTPNSRLSMSLVNIHEILEYVQSLVQAESDSLIELERDYDPSLPDFEADREQLIQAVLNIFRNAEQAINGDGHIWIQTRIKRQCTIRQQLYKLAVQIEIIDDGPGVPSGIEAGVFYPLITGRAEGTGLGLSIAQSLIQSHGGLIEYERIDDKTVFRTLLPIRSNDE
ncbi:MAG: nitrogen regulation protein NR(II) [Gammaproteobacteria bacterium]